MTLGSQSIFKPERGSLSSDATPLLNRLNLLNGLDE